MQRNVALGNPFKNVTIYFLMDVPDPGSSLAVGGGIGFVDMANLEGFCMKDLTVDLKFFGNLLQLFFLICHKGAVGLLPRNVQLEKEKSKLIFQGTQ